MNIPNLEKILGKNIRHITLISVFAGMLIGNLSCEGNYLKSEKVSTVVWSQGAGDTIGLGKLVDTMQSLQWRPIYEVMLSDTVLALQSDTTGGYLFVPSFDLQSDSVEFVVFLSQNHNEETQKYTFTGHGEIFAEFKKFFEDFENGGGVEFDYDALQELMSSISAIMSSTIDELSFTPN